jgi:hypothetical protein
MTAHRLATLLLRAKSVAEQRTAALVAARAAAQVERGQGRSDGAIPGESDARVRAAWILLRTLAPEETPPLDSIVVESLPPHIGGQHCRGVISINRDGVFYQSGDPLALAMVLAHEHHHAMHPTKTEAEVLRTSMQFGACYGALESAPTALKEYVQTASKQTRHDMSGG